EDSEMSQEKDLGPNNRGVCSHRHYQYPEAEAAEQIRWHSSCLDRDNARCGTQSEENAHKRGRILVANCQSAAEQPCAVKWQSSRKWQASQPDVQEPSAALIGPWLSVWLWLCCAPSPTAGPDVTATVRQDRPRRLGIRQPLSGTTPHHRLRARASQW